MSTPNALLRTSDAGIALIKRFESFCANLYRCPAGKPTIGYGHVILPGEQFGTITEAEAIELLRRDLAIAEAAVRRLITTPLTQSQFDARSTLRRRINQRDWPKAASELRRWVHSAVIVLPGLVTRKDEEVALLLRSI